MLTFVFNSLLNYKPTFSFLTFENIFIYFSVTFLFLQLYFYYTITCHMVIIHTHDGILEYYDECTSFYLAVYASYYKYIGVCYFEEVYMVLRRGWYVTSKSVCVTLKRLVWCFEEGGVVLWRGWCGTLKRVVWYFEEGRMLLSRGFVLLWRGYCGTLKSVVWYFEECCVVLWREWCGTLKRVVWYIEDGDVYMVYVFGALFLLFQYDQPWFSPVPLLSRFLIGYIQQLVEGTLKRVVGSL